MAGECKFVTPKKFEQLTGIPVTTQKEYRQRRLWVEGREYIRPSHKVILMNLEEYDRWASGH